MAGKNYTTEQTFTYLDNTEVVTTFIEIRDDFCNIVVDFLQIGDQGFDTTDERFQRWIPTDACKVVVRNDKLNNVFAVGNEAFANNFGIGVDFCNN